MDVAYVRILCTICLTNLIANYAAYCRPRIHLPQLHIEVSLSLAAVISCKLNANSLSNFSNCGGCSFPSSPPPTL